MKIGLMGVFLNNSNMGCVALACSNIRLLKEIAESEKIPLEIVVFEQDYDRGKFPLYEKELGIEMDHISFSEVAWVYSLRGLIHWNRQRSMIRHIKECDFIIDMTGGDSFSDIYGRKRFYFWANIKKYILSQGIPLILGPQTYGPYIHPQVKEMAKSIIEKAALVITRDEKSSEYIQQFADAQIHITTDIAFDLPYEKRSKKRDKGNGKIRAGINISGLLYLKNSDSTLNGMPMYTDYKQYIHLLIESLLEKEKYDIYLIGHVESDMDAIETVKKRYPKCSVTPFGKTPMEVKSDIAEMDLLIGSRMHATIAAFSSRVATIPVAYSRKFIGLYENLGYDVLVDLENMNLNETLALTLQYIEDYKNVQKKVEFCYQKVDEGLQKNKKLIREFMIRENTSKQ